MGTIMHDDIAYNWGKEGGETEISIPNISVNSNGYTYPVKIENGKISGFTHEYNYFRPLDENGNILQVNFSQPFEINVSFTTTELKSQAQVLFGAEQGYYYAPSIELAANNNAIWCGLTTNGSSWDYYLDFLPSVMEGNTIPLNSEVNVNAIWNGTDYIVTVSYDNHSYTLSVTPSSVPYYSSSYNLEFGGINKSNRHYANYVVMDLTKTYIKSNSIKVWGGN